MSATCTFSNENSVIENEESNQPHPNESQAVDQMGESSEKKSETKSETKLANDVANSAKGFCMGVCDAVPGVSGGTVALIVGIYERLFVAISHIDRRLFGLLRQKEWSNAAKHVDARFMVALIVGLGMGYVCMSFAIKYLMASDTLRALTLGSFAGMVIGSIYVVASKLEFKNQEIITSSFCGLIGCGLSVLIALQNTAAVTGEVSLLYLFLCTVVAICAMILPGISGAMLLLIFGVYYYVLEIPRNLIHFENVGQNLLRMSVVLAGCTVGLLTFGRTIKWLLQSYRTPTLSTMLGLMLGSLVVLWPFQNRIEPVIEHHKPTYEVYFPAEFSGLILAVAAAVILFAAAIIVIDKSAARIAKKKLESISSST